MKVTIATATEMKNNFGKYLAIMMAGEEVIVTKNGHEVGRLIPKDKTISYLSDSLRGVLKNESQYDDYKKAREERLKKKYGITD